MSPLPPSLTPETTNQRQKLSSHHSVSKGGIATRDITLADGEKPMGSSKWQMEINK
jgi:hypothetical protein